MAQFANLHDAGRAIASNLRRNLNPPLTDVIAGPPHHGDAPPPESIRVSLLWITPQPTHRSDPWVTNATGESVPPPVTLSGFYLITCYGTTDAGESTQGINLLGQVVQIMESDPIIELPLTDDPVTAAIDPVPGEGRISVSLVPTAADLMEKVYAPLQMRHRPWALFEVGPIQLDSRLDEQPGAAIVAPGGPRLTGPNPISAPVITDMTPNGVRAGGLLRLDTLIANEATELRIGDQIFTFVDAPAAPLEIGRPDAEGRVFVTYPAAGDIGDFDVVARSPAAASDRYSLNVVEVARPGLDAPNGAYVSGAALSLTGGNLAGVDRVFIWPDIGVRAPQEVRELTPDTLAAAQIDFLAGTMTAANLTPGRYRVAGRIPGQAFTPFVLLDVLP